MRFGVKVAGLVPCVDNPPNIILTLSWYFRHPAGRYQDVKPLRLQPLSSFLCWSTGNQKWAGQLITSYWVLGFKNICFYLHHQISLFIFCTYSLVFMYIYCTIVLTGKAISAVDARHSYSDVLWVRCFHITSVFDQCWWHSWVTYKQHSESLCYIEVVGILRCPLVRGLFSMICKACLFGVQAGWHVYIHGCSLPITSGNILNDLRTLFNFIKLE